MSLIIENLCSNIILPVNNFFKKKAQPIKQEQPEKKTPDLDVFFNNEIGNYLKNGAQKIKNTVFTQKATAENKEKPFLQHPDMFAHSNSVPREPESMAKKPVIDIDKALKAFAQKETSIVDGDKYAFHQPSGIKGYGEAMGKYQIVEAELAQWSDDFLGRKVSPKEFQNSPQLQEEYMKNKVQSLIDDGVSLAGIAALHNKGMNFYRNPGVVDQRIKSAGKYPVEFVNIYNSL